MTSERRSLALEAAAVVGGFALLAVAATYPLILHLGDTLPGDLGDPLLNAWTLGWGADRLRHGLSGFWQAPILFPARYAFAFSEQLLGIAIFVAPVMWATGNPVLGHNLAFVGTYVLAGAGMYLLARTLTGRRDAAAIAGVTFAFAPTRAAYLSHLQVLASGWMPVALWGLHGYFIRRSRRALAVFIAAFTLQAWSNAYFLYFLAIPVIVVAAGEIVARRRDAALLKTLARHFAVAAIIILASVAWMVVAYVAVRQLYGFHRTYGEWQLFSADVISYFSVVDSVRVWGGRLAADRGPELQLFPGSVALLLSAVALWPVSPKRAQAVREGGRRIPRLYASIAAIAFLLSLGPELRVWSHRLPLPGPYLVLTRIVPGMDGIRAPARLAVVVLLAVSVLAAIGAARLLARCSRLARRALAGALVAVIFGEGLATPIRLAAFDPRGRQPDRPLYRWLADAAPGAVLELPIERWSIAPTLTYQYATLVHRHAIVNGYSGYGTALQEFLGGSGSPLLELDRMDDVLAMLRAIGIRYVIVHPRDYGDAAFGGATVAAIRDARSHVAAEQPFAEATAFRLRDADTAFVAREGRSRIDARDFTIAASDGADRAVAMVDGDEATRWTTGRPQSGDEWVRIEFNRPRDIARVILVTRAAVDYPRELAVESSSDAPPVALFKDRVLPAFGQSIAALSVEQGSPQIVVDLPRNLTRRLTIRQTGRARRWWSVHELRLVER